MARSDEDGQEEGGERCQENDVTRMTAEHTLGYLNHPIHTAGGLQDTGTGHCCYDNVNDICRRCARTESVVKHEDGQTETGNGSKGEATVF